MPQLFTYGWGTQVDVRADAMGDYTPETRRRRRQVSGRRGPPGAPPRESPCRAGPDGVDSRRQGFQALLLSELSIAGQGPGTSRRTRAAGFRLWEPCPPRYLPEIRTQIAAARRSTASHCTSVVSSAKETPPICLLDSEGAACRRSTCYIRGSLEGLCR